MLILCSILKSLCRLHTSTAGRHCFLEGLIMGDPWCFVTKITHCTSKSWLHSKTKQVFNAQDVSIIFVTKVNTKCWPKQNAIYFINKYLLQRLWMNLFCQRYHYLARNLLKKRGNQIANWCWSNWDNFKQKVWRTFCTFSQVSLTQIAKT